MSPHGKADPLFILEVFDQLEVGPVRITPNQLVMPYILHFKGRSHSTSLRYTYTETVFNPKDAGDHNLAGMIGAQLAINYGLFCKTIRFNGLFSQADRLFIQTMMDNTSCEIYVKKFLEPNPFLTGKVQNLPVILKDRYTRAKIEFIPSANDPDEEHTGEWITSRDSYCVLSSGGKDSLLSYGLLEESGAEVHPVFINESGRHWYTALNAYRQFSTDIPNTARVWTNCDRVFNWMLRHFPFIRKDYASLRADEYPIRLWTVAVFLFGALPLMKKRGIGRMVIGDEYDTTREMYHEGIMHYDGLYDQSRFFDDALTLYFKEKRWNISQFSILRPLAEIMIQKILVKRYPLLQMQQVSCHATHISGGRVYPCGNCEKCRRIVGILIAMDEDPHACGYNYEQISTCLQALQTRKINQISEDAGHLMYLLREKKVFNGQDEKMPALKSRETMSIRFKEPASPLDHIPADLLDRLIQIWSVYTAGIVSVPKASPGEYAASMPTP